MAIEKKFGRFASIIFNNERQIEGLRTVFEITRSPGDFYSKMLLKVHNLSRKSLLELNEGESIKFAAGYLGMISEIFNGTVTNIRSYREGTEIISEIWAADNIKNDDPIINKSYKAQTSVKKIIEELANEAEVKIAKLDFKDENIQGKIVFSEKFFDAIKKITSSFGLVWQVYDGALHVFSPDTDNSMFEFSAKSGLLESPVITEIGVNVKVLLEPAIKPGDTYNIQATGAVDSRNLYSLTREVQMPTQIAQTIVHSGDTHGDIWMTTIEGYHKERLRGVA